jgi:glycosyltransferase involved in cell wall biosynthesis
MASPEADTGKNAGLRPKLIFLVTEDWYFWAHRLPQARAARDAGFQVSVATRVDRHGDRICGEGFALHSLGWRRGSINPLRAIAAVREVARLYRGERPAIVHHVSQKPIFIGSLAAGLAGVSRVVNALTGLGFLFASSNIKARAVRSVIMPVLRRVARRPGVRFLVENPDDRAMLRRLNLVPQGRIVLINGSGVDLSHYKILPEPEGEAVIIGCATRMLGIKGVGDVVAAFRLLKARRSRVRLLLAGAPDPENPDSIPEATLHGWAAEPGVEWLGHVTDVRQVWTRAHIAVLASRGGEGIPMCLMEAAACGRALVATDVPGCREIVLPGETGLLVPVQDPMALAEALERMVDNDAFRQSCREGARRRVEGRMDSVTVGRETVALYRALLDGRAGAPP